MAAYISVSIDVASAAQQMSSDSWAELFNEFGRSMSSPERLVELMRRDVSDELDDDGKAFLKACSDYFNEQFPKG